jgi:uncharacterized protein (TIGR02117 family)
MMIFLFSKCRVASSSTPLLIVAVSTWLLLVSACTTPPSHIAERPATDTVYVVAHGWHAGVALPVRHADTLLAGPLAGASAQYVEVGWGDRRYYPADSPGIGTLVQAGLWPTPSTVHVVSVPRRVPEYFRANDIVAIPTPDSLMQRVTEYFLAAMEYDRDGGFVEVADGLYGASYFFGGVERYHAFNNCNHWVARALRLIGCEVSVFQSLTLGSLMRQARACGVVYDRSGA